MMEYTMDGKTYKLHYSMKRLEVIEGATNVSPLTVLTGISKQEFPQINVVKTYFAYGLMDEGGVYAPGKKAVAFAEEYITSHDLVSVLLEIVDVLSEDCGFLFPSDLSNSNT